MPHSQPHQSTSKSETWENEGGSLSPQDVAESLGIVRHLTETYSIGGYQYTNLMDAIAQARRMAKLEREIL
ncbi:MAG: hypothetical protein ACTHKM_11775 [Tsuneonella sp.]